jgi:hypothetical protein
MSRCVVSPCREGAFKGPVGLFCAPHWTRLSQETKHNLYRSYNAWRKGRLGERVFAAAVDDAKKEARKNSTNPLPDSGVTKPVPAAGGTLAEAKICS